MSEKNLLSNLKDHVATHGVWFSIRAVFVRGLNKFAEVVISKVGRTLHKKSYPLDPNYQNEIIGAAQYKAHVPQNALHRLDAFARGDSCIANFERASGKLVGYLFYTKFPTRVADDVEFFFSDQYLYAYAAYIDPEHRGRGLAPSMWTTHKRWREEENLPLTTLHYIDVTNLPSLRSGSSEDTTIIGYTGYVRLFGKRYCWRSPGCVREAVGFRNRSLHSPQPHPSRT